MMLTKDDADPQDDSVSSQFEAVIITYQ
jgi:hypothetical protein